MDELFACPLRENGIANDQWRLNNECSFCGSVHPDTVTEMLAKGAPVGTDEAGFWIQNEDGIKRPVHTEHMTKEQFAAFLAKAGTTAAPAAAAPATQE